MLLEAMIIPCRLGMEQSRAGFWGSLIVRIGLDVGIMSRPRLVHILEFLEKYDVDVIAGPCDSRFASVGSAAGVPVGNLPLGFAHFNGRPFSLHVLAPKDEDVRILRVMSAWEATFPENVRPPPLLAPK